MDIGFSQVKPETLISLFTVTTLDRTFVPIYIPKHMLILRFSTFGATSCVENQMIKVINVCLERTIKFELHKR